MKKYLILSCFLLAFAFVNAQIVKPKLLTFSAVEFGFSADYFKSEKVTLIAICDFKVKNKNELSKLNLNYRIGYARGKYSDFLVPYERYRRTKYLSDGVSHELFTGFSHTFFKNNNVISASAGMDLHYFFLERSRNAINGNTLYQEQMLGTDIFVSLNFLPKKRLSFSVESLLNLGFIKTKTLRTSNFEVVPFKFQIDYFTRGFYFKLQYNLIKNEKNTKYIFDHN